MRPDELSFAVLTYNEAEHIEEALRSLPSGFPVFVLDAESTDDTVALARKLGAVVEVRPWTSFLDARRFLLSRITTPWTFMLDADERIEPELQAALLAVDGQATAYRCLRKNRFCGRVIQGGAWGKEEVLRCARTDQASIAGRAGGTLHEYLLVPGATGLLDGAIDHLSYPTIASYWQKFARYTTIEAREAEPAKLYTVFLLIPPALARMLWQFLGRGGWRDGWRGGFIAFASALYPLVVAWKRVRAHS